ncbi:MAG: SLBB domain-containing protein [Candidatus Sericytochromatia bacterium]|nr:SLBB domain-containing protein [Candidatus Tanganyikabacteria bacterium]
MSLGRFVARIRALVAAVLMMSLLAPPAPALEETGGDSGAKAKAESPVVRKTDVVEAPPEGLDFALDTPEAIKNYVLSVGDKFTVNVWGQDLRFTETFTIPFEGRIFMPQVGEIEVRELTTAQVKQRIAAILARRHPGLNVSVLLVATRPIKVFLTGLVSRPGTVTVSALARLSAALAAAGGVLPYGSRRQISLKRYGETRPQIVDLYKFLHKGEIAGNPIVKAGDVINIPPLRNLAAIGGAINRAGTYEFLDGETVEELIAMGHGLKPDAAPSESSIVSMAGTVRADRVEKRLDLSVRAGLDRKLRPQDLITVPANTLSFVDLGRTRVTIAGAVAKPGTYALTVGTKLRDALYLAGGPKSGSGLQEVRIYHNVASGDTRFIDEPDKANAYRLLYDRDESQNLDLRDGDLILVPDSKDLAEDNAVYVYGQVGKPGKVAFRAGDRLSDYLNRAGGALDKANLRGVSVTRSSLGKSFGIDAHVILKEGKFDTDPELKPGDIVNVPEQFFYFSNGQDYINAILALVSVTGALFTIYNAIPRAQAAGS